MPSNPVNLSELEPKIGITEIIIKFIVVNNFDAIQEVNFNNYLKWNDYYRKIQDISELLLTNIIPFNNITFFRININQQQNNRFHENWLCFGTE